ncbi:putative tail sheath protein [Pseudomonas phage VW-6B]|nr:putative tail sheath protein [Pseudomonas phage VW-6B]
MSDFYYGQGKLYLARRNTAGQALSWRWVGDVSALDLELEFDEKKTKGSAGGQLVTMQRYISAVSGKITSTWHEYAPENLEALLSSNHVSRSPNLFAQDTLPTRIVAGDRISLSNQQVWGVRISGLTEGVNYIVDKLWGVVVWLTTPMNQPVVVNYEHSGNETLPILTHQGEEFALRYEGINLAENNSPILIEIYRVKFDPISKMALLSKDSDLSGLETSADILYDFSKGEDPLLGRLGRIVTFKRLSGITHNGVITHNGAYTHRG